VNRISPLAGAIALCSLVVGSPLAAEAQGSWNDYAGNAQHTALSTVASQSLGQIIWQTSVDLNPQYSGNDLLIHYGSPLVSANNTVIVPVKTGATDGFEVEALNGTTGALLWQQSTDYTLPPHKWTPSFSPTLTSTGRIYMAGPGGTLYYRDNVDSASGTFHQVAFFGNLEYNLNPTAFNDSLQIDTPLTTDAAGDVYFGYHSNGASPLNLGINSGIARVQPNGNSTFYAVPMQVNGDIVQLATNCAPAISKDGKTVYVTAIDSSKKGYLLALDSTSLEVKSSAVLTDPLTGNNAIVSNNSSASPMVGPDGNVYYGVLESPFNSSKGWMLQFNADLSQEKTPGAFGWDDTPSVVPASMVPSYHGTSKYLLMTKYNNYAELGGDGVNKLAILDPNDTQIDARTGATVMKEVLTIAGVTPAASLSCSAAWRSREAGLAAPQRPRSFLACSMTSFRLLNGPSVRVKITSLSRKTFTSGCMSLKVLGGLLISDV